MTLVGKITAVEGGRAVMAGGGPGRSQILVGFWFSLYLVVDSFGAALWVEQILQNIAGLEGPVVIGGEINMVPCRYTLRSF